MKKLEKLKKKIKLERESDVECRGLCRRMSEK